MELTGYTILMSGGSRGIGLAIARAASAKGANVALLAKTDEPHPKLPGTVHTAADEVAKAGGQALAIVGDVRSEEDVSRAVSTTVSRFGGVDCLINNASAIDLRATLQMPNGKFRLMHDVNVLGSWLMTKAALPHMLQSSDARLITMAPPINMSPYWLGKHPAYTISKFSMTLLTLGWASEFSQNGIAAYCLWPETLIDTAAVRNVVGGAESARSPKVVADAAMALFARSADAVNGNTFVDTEVLREEGIYDFQEYGGGPHPTKDLFLD